MENTLYIIGNGFDLHHNIQSSYNNFRDYIQEKDKKLLDVVDTYLQIDEDWSDFESALSTMDIDTLMDYSGQFLVSYSAEDWSDSYHHDYQYEIEQVVEQLSSQLKQYFIEWLKNIYIPSRKELYEKLLTLNKSALYLNFNYTNSLKKIYKIKQSKILHIHGALKKSKNIVLGHNWKPTSKYLDTPNEQSEMDVRVMEGNEILERYFTSTFKPTKKIIKLNKHFFSKVKKIDKIFILGHSLSDVDLDYFKKIAKHTDSKVHWIVSYYNNEAKVNYKKQFKKLEIKKNSITYTKLKNLVKLRG